MVTEGNENLAKVAQQYCCELCDFKSCNKRNYEKHLSTLKHKSLQDGNKFARNGNNGNENLAKSCKTIFVCENCEKSYFHKSGLSRHKRQCSDKNKSLIDGSNNKLEITGDLVMKILNDNQELRNLMIKQQEQISEMIPRIGNNNITNTTQNNNNFNIHLFLNEQCKDAVNMSDFVKSIDVNPEQLIFTKQNGLEKGLTKTILDNMKRLSVYQRPLHCTDVKRETLYIKEQDQWTKEGSHDRLKSVIQDTSMKNYHALKAWQLENPDFMENEKKSDFFARAVIALGSPINAVDERIIKNLCREIYVKDALQ